VLGLLKFRRPEKIKIKSKIRGRDPRKVIGWLPPARAY
jgi:hypothetical protein